ADAIPYCAVRERTRWVDSRSRLVLWNFAPCERRGRDGGASDGLDCLGRGTRIKSPPSSASSPNGGGARIGGCETTSVLPHDTFGHGPGAARSRDEKPLAVAIRSKRGW